MCLKNVTTLFRRNFTDFDNFWQKCLRERTQSKYFIFLPGLTCFLGNFSAKESKSVDVCRTVEVTAKQNKKLCYCRQTAPRAMSVCILSTTAQLQAKVVQQIHDKSH